MTLRILSAFRHAQCSALLKASLILVFAPFLMASSGCGTYGSASQEYGSADPASESETTTVASDTTLTLAVNESTDLATHTVAFRDVVEDSRCPRGVDCVWEGRVVVALEVDDKRVELSNHERDENHTFTLDDGVLVLETVNPYPDAENPSDEEPEAVIEWVKGKAGEEEN